MYTKIKKSGNKRTIANSDHQKQNTMQRGLGFVDNRSNNKIQHRISVNCQNYTEQDSTQLKQSENNRCQPIDDTMQRVVAGMDSAAARIITKVTKPKGFFSSAEGAIGYPSLLNFVTYTDKVITLWGHAGQNKFGGDWGYYTASELVNSLLGKGLKNSNHTELQILGCMPSGSQDGTMSYAQQLQSIFDKLHNDQGITRKIIVKTFPSPSTYEGSTTITYGNIDKYLYVYGPKTDITDWETQMGKGQVGGSDAVAAELTNYKFDIKCLAGFENLKHKTGDIKSVRSSLTKPKKPKDYKKGKKKGELTELLIGGHH